MTKPQLIEKLATKSELSKVEVSSLLDALVEVATEDVLNAGDSITIPGLGTFKQKNKPARTGRNPQSGAAIQIGAKTSIVFKMTSSLKA